MSGDTKKLIAYNYFGSKFSWIDQLYANFPKDIVHLIDVFGGSFVVSLNCPQKNIIRTANEINGEITNFFMVLRDHEHELISKLLLTPVSRLEYDNCWNKTHDPIEKARRFYVRTRQSFMALGGQKKNKGWHLAKTQVRCANGESVSKFNKAIPKLHYVAKQIRQNFQITNYHFRDCIEKLDFPEAFFYFDPPYPEESRASFNDYKFEFTTEDHIELARLAHSIEGKAMISCYLCDLYEDLYSDWRMVKLQPKYNNIRSGKVQEVIWMNYPEEKTIDLFSDM